ncbi:MAG TPA: GNAT family N-acetyltransferase, partial [Marmoricola sp.]
MVDLGPVPWPPTPIRTPRLVLRESEPTDRALVIDLYASADVHAFLGGPRPRDELEREVPPVPGQRAGYFVVDLDGAAIGTVSLTRRAPERSGHLPGSAAEVELSYLFRPEAWGRGYATEACSAVLAWLGEEMPGEPVVL